MQASDSARFKSFVPPAFTTPHPTLDKHRVAVLPLQNLSPDPNDEYFADGMTEELISTISKIQELSVISRTSVMGYKKKDKKALEIAKELNVGTLLEGSVRKAASRVRIAVQLIDAESDKHLWAENYDRNLEDIFAVQSEVAEKVASSLRLKLTEEAKKRIEKRGTASVEAYTLYLKGLLKLGPDADSAFAAIECFEQALGLDPDYALAYSGLSRAHAALGFNDAVEPKVAYQKAEKYARKALELDESLAEAHLALAQSLANTYDFKTRQRELKRALELNPNLASAHVHLSNVYQCMLRWNNCLREVERAVELDPVGTYGIAGTDYLYAGHYEKDARLYEKAVRYLKADVELHPSSSFFLNNLGLAYVTIGMIEEGLAMVKRASEIDGPRTYGDLAWAYVRAQKPEEARKLLTVLEAEERKHNLAIAGVYAVLGEKEKAMDWLERAYDERSGYLAGIDCDFVYENLRTEPRYQALLEKLDIKKPM